jgi:hypothetical protein
VCREITAQIGNISLPAPLPLQTASYSPVWKSVLLFTVVKHAVLSFGMGYIMLYQPSIGRAVALWFNVFDWWDIFSLRHLFQTGSGAHPASYPVGTRGCCPGVKRPGRKADHSPPSSAEVKEWVELYLRSPICFHGVVHSLITGYLVKQEIRLRGVVLS